MTTITNKITWQAMTLAPHDPQLTTAVAALIQHPIESVKPLSTCERLTLCEYVPCGDVDPLLIVPDFAINATARERLLAWRDSMETARRLSYVAKKGDWQAWWLAHAEVCAQVRASLDRHLSDGDAAWLRSLLARSQAAPLEFVGGKKVVAW